VSSSEAIESAFSAHRKLLWGLCYRMSGCAADADDLLQDTFERALRNPPTDQERELRPWLVRVAMNASRDHLRKRKQRGYDGPWLPSPIEVRPGEQSPLSAESPEARYCQLESISFAFLRAAEALSPGQRAVLLLRDVLDLSVRETADALEMSEANVKTSHHRARTAMRDYDETRRLPSEANRRAARRALEAFMLHLQAGNIEALRQLVADDVLMLNDGGGEFFAARKPLQGFDKVVLFHQKVKRLRTGLGRVALCSFNGSAALMADVPSDRPRVAARTVGWVELDERGRIAEIHWVMATRKLAHLDWSRLQAPGPRAFGRALLSAATHPAPMTWAVPAARRMLGTLFRAALSSKTR